MYSWGECRDLRTACSSRLPVSGNQKKIRSLFTDDVSLTEGRMFASVLFRRIFFSLVLISGVLHLLIACHCICLAERYIFEIYQENAIIKIGGIGELLCGQTAEKFSRKPDSGTSHANDLGETLRQVLQRLPGEEKNDGKVFIFDRNLNIVFHPDPQLKKLPAGFFRGKLPDPDLGHTAEPAVSCLSESGKNICVKYIKERGWYVAVSPDVEPAEYRIRTLQNQILLSLSVSYALSLLIFAYLLHYFLTPLKYLMNTAGEFIRKGRISERRFVADSGEIGLLSWALYRMADQLEESTRKIKSHDRECTNLLRSNDRARERAYDLGKINERLEWKIRMYREAEASLRQSEERYRAMLENIEECFYEADLLGNLVFFNDALCRMLGYSKEELLAMNFRDFMEESTAEKAEKTFTRAFETGIPAKGFEWTLIRKDGSHCYVEISVFLIKDVMGEVLGFRGVARNISDLLYLIYHDSLTGLYNRKAFFQKLKETLAYARRDNNEKNIFYMDLDRFKQVNDDYGHDVGDEILKEVAARLKNTLRETDHICRLGGDEFTVILNNTGGSNAAEAARRIIESISNPYNVKEYRIDFITPSIGISSYPRDALDVEALVKCADVAMYASKKHRGCFTFYDKSLEEEYARSAEGTEPRPMGE